MKAYTYHHTHWDSEWYFTEQEAQVQLVYHMKELLYALEENLIQYYHLDGKSGFMEYYFEMCPEDREPFTRYVEQGRIILGPLYEQLSSFLAPGESIVKNLQMGMAIANSLGGSSKIAYIPDSFGQIQDFPKIFSGFGIEGFVFRRGMGDVHKLKNDFWWKSNDGSKILTSVLQAGYSFAGLAFYEGRLIKNAGLNLDKKSILNQMRLCAQESTLEPSFLLPAGKDNCPVMLDFNKLIQQYNEESDEFEFEETNFDQYFGRLQKSGDELQSYQGEFYTTQYHRVHKSIFSARPDIKIMQDKTERLMIYEVQPLMCMLDALGIRFERNLADEVWKLLIGSQTHSEATNSDEVNEQILKRVEKAYLYARSIKVYLTRKVAYTVKEQPGLPLVLFNTLPFARSMDVKLDIFTKTKDFTLHLGDSTLTHSVIAQEKVYGGWKRKYSELLDSDRDYYLTTIALSTPVLPGCSYNTICVEEGVPGCAGLASASKTYIENDSLRVEFFRGKIGIRDKKRGIFFEDAVSFEDMGDCGDTFDYDYPDQDWRIEFDFVDAQVQNSFETNEISELTLAGALVLPMGLKERAAQTANSRCEYKITFRLRKNSEILEIRGGVANMANNHRLRLVLSTGIPAENSVAGTQFGYIARPCNPPEREGWKENGWLEEPNPIEPLLNHTSLVGNSYTVTAFTRSTKEYEIIGDDYSKIALTLYRSVGHFGLPDLNRRPGRASGIPEEIMECPLSQMVGKNIEFSYGICVYDSFDAQRIQRDYTCFATDPVYFQKQDYNRIFTPMKYFEVNPAVVDIPKAGSLLSLQGCEALYSALTKAQEGEAYILRLYSNSAETVSCGRLESPYGIEKIERVTLAEQHLETLASNELGPLQEGEIKTFKIYLTT